MRRRHLLLLAAGAGISLHAAGQGVAAAVAVPFYTPPAFMQGVHAHWYAPRSRAFADAAQELVQALSERCVGGLRGTDGLADAAGTGDAAVQLQAARSRWQAAALAWDRLAAVAVGPLVQRRSARQIDFAPTRPELIARALRAAPADLQALERVGTPAKGLPALEWLLWAQPPAPGSAGCRYGVLLAQEIAAEASALAAAFADLAARDWAADEAAAVAAMSELVNQWVGGLERLRWADIDKPLRSARAGQPPAFPRAASGSTRTSWLARWDGLRTLAVAPPGVVAPAPGAGLAPLETYLRGRGLNPLADRLAAAAAQAGRQLEAVNPAQGASTASAVRALAGVKRLAEAEVAPALEVQIGFSDSDGD